MGSRFAQFKLVLLGAYLLSSMGTWLADVVLGESAVGKVNERCLDDKFSRIPLTLQIEFDSPSLR